MCRGGWNPDENFDFGFSIFDWEKRHRCYPHWAKASLQSLRRVLPGRGNRLNERDGTQKNDE